MTPSILFLIACGVLLSGVVIFAAFRPRSARHGRLLKGRSPHADVEFDASPEEVARAVRQILALQPIYTETVEKEGRAFTTTVRRNRWVLGTEMTVELRPSGARTSVAVLVNTLWFVRSDAIHTHMEYLYEFLAALRAEFTSAVS